MTTKRTELECEFPPKMEEDLTHVRRKRLTTETGLVCLEDYPYTVSVRLHGKHWCGGAIVGKLWVLTAAQCFDYVTKEEVSVRMGSVFRDFGGRILSVVEIKRHPDYRMDQYYPEHNLAMVKVNLPITQSSRMQAVSLAVSDADLPPLFGETVVTGYGSVGDTGDPAVHFSGLNRAGTLYGIALFSGTEECAYKSKPGIFAKVAYSRLWIDKVLGDIPDHPESADSTENLIPIDIM
ncbi:unnamed protein product [Spodoptera exigua]|nr:unnamed protein product [Spodoptera exigua]